MRKQQGASDRFSDRQLEQMTSRMQGVFVEGLEELVLPGFERVEADARELKAGQARLEQGQARLEKGQTDLFKQVQRIDDSQVILVTEVKAIKKQLSHSMTREEYETLKSRLTRVEKHLGLT